MKRKVIIIITLLSIGIIGFGGYTIFADSAGYEAYKEALKKTHTVKNASTTVVMEVVDNGEVLNKTNLSVKYDLEEKLMEGRIDIQSPQQQHGFHSNYQDGKFIVKRESDEEAYYLTEFERQRKDSEEGEKFHNPEMLKLGEMFVDALMQPVQSEFNMIDNRISIDMKKEEIPKVLQVLGSQMIKMGVKQHSDIVLTTEEYPFLAETYSFTMPPLEEDISIESVLVDVKLSEEGLMEEQNSVFIVNGLAQDGKFHELQIKMAITIYDIDSTTIQNISLENQNLEQFEMKHVHDFH
ncbi:hypothetical protein RZN25_12910 [Bacillaceae bacterium S4-13-56]